MFQTVIVDDDPNSINAAKEALKSYDEVEIIASFQNSLAFFEFAQKASIDIVFLDIELERETGFDIAKKIQKEYPKISIVFLTGHASYAVDSYDFQPAFFLTKPISADKLGKAMDVLRRKQKSPKVATHAKVMFRCRNEYKMLEVSKIDYIERTARKNYVICQTEKLQIAGYTLNELLEMLSKYGFMMCHQSYLVSVSHIESVYDENKQLYSIRIKGTGKVIPVSRNRYHELKKMIEEYAEIQI